jgi:predicted DNA-binding transcriptional regulator AlpA
MPRTIPDDLAEGVDQVMRIFQAMGKAAQHQAKTQPTHDGLYPVTLMMNAAGGFVCDEQGMPIVVIPPLTIACTDDKTVEFFHTEQRLSPKKVAAYADVHKATVQRAVNDGELPKPIKISSRRVVHRLSDVQDWFARRQNGTRK